MCLRPRGQLLIPLSQGGSLVLMDRDTRMTFTYVMNKLGPGLLGNPRTFGYVQAAYDALKTMKGGSKM